MLQKEIKDLTFEVSDPSTCLQFLLFLHDRSIVHFHNWGGGGGGGAWEGAACGCYNCIIPNIKFYCDKKYF